VHVTDAKLGVAHVCGRIPRIPGASLDDFRCRDEIRYKATVVESAHDSHNTNGDPAKRPTFTPGHKM